MNLGALMEWARRVTGLPAALSITTESVRLDPNGPVRPGDALAFGWRTVNGVRRPGHCGLVVSVPGYTGPVPPSVRRAEAALARAAWYRLGAAGLEDDGLGDCSGALLEWLDVERVQPCAGWGSINTSAAIADATGPRKIFRPAPQPHPWAALGVIDCSSAHPKGRAVGRRTGALWGERGGIVLRLV